MEKIVLNESFKDERGKIIDLVEKEEIGAVTLITFKRGAVRGNHFHKKTTQWNYILSGRILIRTQKEGENMVDTILTKGDFFVTPQNEKHALKALEDSELLVLTKGPRCGKEYESDTCRIKILE